MKKSEYYELDLLRLLGALWHRFWAILLSGLLLSGAGFAISSYVLLPKYEAEALMYVNNTSSSLGSTSFSISSSELTAAQSLADTYIIILKTRATLNEVIEKENLDYTYEELSEKVSSETVNSTEVFSIRVTSNDPQEAMQIANAIAKILPQKISNVVDGSSVRVVDYAALPEEAVSPNVIKYTALGFLVGAILACGIIVIFALMDTLIHEEAYLIETYPYPILAVIPDHAKPNQTPTYHRANRNVSKAEESV